MGHHETFLYSGLRIEFLPTERPFTNEQFPSHKKLNGCVPYSVDRDRDFYTFKCRYATLQLLAAVPRLRVGGANRNFCLLHHRSSSNSHRRWAAVRPLRAQSLALPCVGLAIIAAILFDQAHSIGVLML